MLLPLGFWLATGDGLPSVAVVALFAFILSTGGVAFFAAAQRVIPRLVLPQHLERANGYLESALVTGDQMVGPAIGSAFSSRLSIPIVGDAASFVASAALLYKLPPIPPEAQRTESLNEEVRRGWRWFVTHKGFRTLTLATTVMSSLTSFVVATEVVIVTSTLGLADFWLGPLTAVIAAGSVLGSTLAPHVIRRLGTNVLPLATFLSGLLYIGASGSRSVLVVFLFLSLQSGLIGLNNVSTASIRQRSAPADIRGRVVGLSRSIIVGVQVPGALIGGWIAKTYGTDTMLVVAGVGLIVFSLATARPLRRILETLPQPGSAMAE